MAKGPSSNEGGWLRKTFAGRYFALNIDDNGYKPVGWLRTVEGGEVKSGVVAQNMGGTAEAVKYIGRPEFTALSVSAGAAMSAPFWSWIKASIDGDLQRRTGSVELLNFQRNIVHEISFRDALITDTVIPRFDSQSKDPVYLNVKFQAEEITHRSIDNESEGRPAELPSAHKDFRARAFRVEVDGLDMRHTATVDQMTISQTVKPFPVGGKRVYQLEPVALKFPDLTMTMPVGHADSVMAWFEDFVVKGNNTREKEKTGSLTLLNGNRSEDLLTISLYGLGISSLSIDKLDTSSNTTAKMCKFSLYCERMGLEYHV